jgi:hypothetical protein
MFPARLFMGIVFFVMCGWMIGGIAEGQTGIMTSDQKDDIMILQSSNIYTTIDSSGTGAIKVIDKALNWINTYILYDWSVFYDIGTGYTSATCATAGGTWQSTSSTCKIPNTFIWLRYVLCAILGATLVITLFMIFKKGSI